MIKTVIMDRYQFSEEQLQKIRELGYDVSVHIGERKIPLTEEELECEVLIQENAFVINRAEDLKRVKFVQGTAAGTDAIPMDTLQRMGVKYSNARGIFSIPMAEFTLMRLLEVYKRARVFEELKEKKIWKRFHSIEDLKGKKAAFLGTGDIAQETAKRLRAFDVEVVGFNRSEKPAPYFDTVYPIGSVKEKIGDYDIVIAILPLNEESRGLVGKEFFDAMKEGSLFVNVGRGPVVEERALIQAMKEKKLMAAVLDVFEKEPLSEDSPLWEFDNFYFSPHNSGVSQSNVPYLFDLIYENLKAYKNGTEIRNRLL